MQPIHNFLATCPRYFETFLAKELASLNAENIKPAQHGVYFSANQQDAYRICLWSRLANRVLLQLDSFPGQDPESLYNGVKTIDWTQHFTADMTFLVHFVGQSSALRNTHFSALKIKDAIVDQFREKTGERPAIDIENPGVRITAYLIKNKISIYLDFTRTSLHKRGYRTQYTIAPLKENLASVILAASNWQTIAKTGGSLIDPMCGSGTFLIEAAMIATDTAPGLANASSLLNNWKQHDKTAWKDVVNEAKKRQKTGLATSHSRIIGFEADSFAFKSTAEHIKQSGFSAHIEIHQKELAYWTFDSALQPGLIVTNPPYGERLGDKQSINYLYQRLGKIIAKHINWKVAIFSADTHLLRALAIEPEQQHSFLNGKIPCQLMVSTVHPTHTINESTELTLFAEESTKLNDDIKPFANRLIKNTKHLAKWARRENIVCYRLYDADLPDYALAIDCYGSNLHVQEYAAPKSIDPEKAQQRLQDAVNAIKILFKHSDKQIVIKKRQRQKRLSQYEKQNDHQKLFVVSEKKASFLINLTDYLDTGLFLDHRNIRFEIASMADGKRFLNLFCYTATASIHAALNGASQTTSVDLSNTYLDWAKKNFALNGLSDDQHQLIQMDVTEWLKINKKKFDLILLDPPTFSNSKRMHGNLDIQRDHVQLIQSTMRHLSSQGTLFFSTHFQHFQLSTDDLDDFILKDITADTIATDFKRHKKIHQCWKIQHKIQSPWPNIKK